jgi:hypothetical protein
MPADPPARGLALLRKNRPAALLLKAANQVILGFASFERCSQELVDFHGVECSSMRNAVAGYGPIAGVEQDEDYDQGDYESAEIFFPISHKVNN